MIKGKKLRKQNCYLGNTKLKRDGATYRYTPELKEEFIKCSNDVVYFVKEYMKIVHVDRGLIPFDMYDFQEDLIRNIQDNRFSITLASRQIGKSVTTIAFLLHFILFNKYKRVGIIANKGATARKILKKLKLAYENLPHWLQSGVVEWNKGSIELSNGCIVEASSTSGDAVRGDSLSLLFIDEAAFIEKNLWTEFYTSVYPTISSGETTKIVLVSTANGMNHYYKMWNDAKSGKSKYSPFEVNWKMVPNRTQEFMDETIANTSPEQFSQEHENSFLGNTNTLLSSVTLGNLPIFDPEQRDINNTKIYEAPDPTQKYFISVDVGQGVNLDYSVINVINISEYPFKQAALYRSNSISPLFLPSIIEGLATKYNEAFVLIENNDIGTSVVNDLNFSFEYPNIISIKTGSEGKYKLGMRTTKRTKSSGCSNIKELVEGNKLLICDFDTINEFSTFVKSKNSYEAEAGYNDDIVMSFVNFAFFTTTELFLDIYENDVREVLMKKRMEDLENTMLPDLIIDDGLNDLGDGEGVWIPVNINGL